MGRSLAQDRRRKAGKSAGKGQGDKGDRAATPARKGARATAAKKGASAAKRGAGATSSGRAKPKAKGAPGPPGAQGRAGQGGEGDDEEGSEDGPDERRQARPREAGQQAPRPGEGRSQDRAPAPPAAVAHGAHRGRGPARRWPPGFASLAGE